MTRNSSLIHPVADATLHFVDPDSKLGYAIGTFIVAWGDLEQQLDIGFHVLFHTDPTLALCMYANLGTKAKIEILQSAIALQEKAIGKGRSSRARRVLQRVAELSDQARLTELSPNFVDGLMGQAALA
jgi:hypothetical protein